MKKRVLLISNTAWSLVNFRKNLMNKLAEDHHVICLAPEDEFSKYLTHEYRVLKMQNQGKNPIQDVALIFRLYRLFNQLKPDLILSYTIKLNIYGTIAANLLKIPIIVTLAGLGTTFRKKGVVASIIKNLYRFALPKAEHICFQNRDDKQLLEQLIELDPHKFSILPGSGVDTDWFSPGEKTQHEEFRFLFLGRLLREKGIGEYVQAARKLSGENSKVKFQILGFTDVENPTAVSRKELQNWQKEGIIEYLGSTSDVREHIAQADCVVLPSYYGEGVPRSLLEAASMQKPIVTTDNVGCREVVVDRKNGFLCEPQNVEDLSQKLRKISELPKAKLSEMGKFGRQKMIDQFSEQIVINKMRKIIERILP